MRTISTVAFALIVGTFANVAAIAQSSTVTYRDAVRLCGAEWRASDARKAVAKGEGMKAWNAFRADCVTRVGYAPTRRGVVAKNGE